MSVSREGQELARSQNLNFAMAFLFNALFIFHSLSQTCIMHDEYDDVIGIYTSIYTNIIDLNSINHLIYIANQGRAYICT